MKNTEGQNDFCFCFHIFICKKDLCCADHDKSVAKSPRDMDERNKGIGKR